MKLLRRRPKKRQPPNQWAQKPNPLKLDPTRTARIRRELSQTVAESFNRLKAKLIQLVLGEDAFGMTPPAFGMGVPVFAGNQRWRNLSSPDQLKQFEQWLKSQIGAELQNLTQEQAWQRFIQQGFQQGAGRAFDDTRKTDKVLADSQQKMDFYAGTKDEFLRSSFANPVAVEKVKLLAGRSLSDVKGITEQMATTIRRELVDGLVKGESPQEIARSMVKAVDIGKSRAEMIAQSAIIAVHAEGQLDALEQMGMEEVGIAVELSSAGDNRVCSRCKSLEGVVLKISEARGLLPIHPRCRCAIIPSLGEDDSTPQKRTKKEIDRAAKAADVKLDVSKDRPESILDTPQPGRSIAEPIRKNNPATTTVPGFGAVQWVPDPIANPRSNVTILIDPAKLDRDWSKKAIEYIPAGGGGAEIGGRREGFKEFLKTGKPVEASRVVLDDEGNPSFVNGRHRYSVVRDSGAGAVAVTVPKRDAEEMMRRYGVDAKAEPAPTPEAPKPRRKRETPPTTEPFKPYVGEQVFPSVSIPAAPPQVPTAPVPPTPAPVPVQLPTPAASIKPLPGQQAIEMGMQSAKTLGEKLYAAGAMDTRILDDLYGTPQWDQAGFSGNNEVLRSLDNIYRQRKRDIASGAVDPNSKAGAERINQSMDSQQSKMSNLIEGLRKIGQNDAAAWYEQHGPALIEQARADLLGRVK